VTEKEINRIELSLETNDLTPFPLSIHYYSAPVSLTQPGRGEWNGSLHRGGLAMLDRDAKELLIGWSAILIFAFALVYFQQ
jgi:hypothetical protein